MRTHGWGGSPPRSDEEAVARILDAAAAGLDRVGRDLRIADVARDLGVTRQTVYRYFPSTDDLVAATAVRASGQFLDQVKAHAAGLDDPADAVIQALVFTLDHLHDNTYLDIALAPGGTQTRAAQVTSPIAREFGLQLVKSLDVDWSAAGFDQHLLTELVEHMLRLTQSLILDPGDPPRHGDQLNAYLNRWLRPAITAATQPVGRSSR
ncbi:MAG TPA: TetR/AcrR family transcriptional regulator [Rugosimonospora sp.]|nr:TetR/AcrR family transcriptional regulator [Rugosimonospora sp.]